MGRSGGRASKAPRQEHIFLTYSKKKKLKENIVGIPVLKLT